MGLNADVCLVWNFEWEVDHSFWFGPALAAKLAADVESGGRKLMPDGFWTEKKFQWLAKSEHSR